MSKHAPRRSPRLKARVWVEIGGRPALTDAAADLLEQIAVCGSLSAAARKLRFSYRRAWMLADGMNRRWGRPVVATATGGKKGGGAVVTEFGRALLGAYREVQVQVEFAVDRQAAEFARFMRAAQA